jgi:O-succinylbenzoic acid--CoA ligase
MGVMSEMLSRELITVLPEWELPQVTQTLQAALAGIGPALAFAPTSTTRVSEEVAVVIPTSGSTGTAKEVAYTADALRASARSAHAYLGAQSGDTWSLLLPINHIAGVNVLVRALELDTDVLDFRNTNNFRAGQFTSVVPTQLHRAVNGDHELLAHLQAARKVLVGGAATNEALLKDAITAGIEVVTTYGMSEMSGGCVYNNEPLAGVAVELDETGLVRLRGPMMAHGYLNYPDLWQQATSDGWFTTNDLATLIDGRLYITGRADDVIISGGENISLSAIDVALNNHFAPKRFISVGIADPEWGTKLCIASDADINEQAIRDFLRVEMGNHATPKAFLTLPDLPMRGIGKPDREALVRHFTLSE